MADRTPAELAAARAARVISFAAAVGLSGFLFIYPRALGSEPGGEVYGALVTMMVGICLAFSHGVGFVPRTRWVRACFRPVCAWPLMAVGAVLLFVR